MDVDVVTVEVLRNAFNSIATQMNRNMARSAYSPIIYEMKDCSVALFDDEARMLGQSTGLPVFLGSLEAAVRAILDHFGRESMRPGDAYLVNDSYIVGSHLNDVSVLSPIFFDGGLVGFGATKAHWIDIGAKSPSQAMDSTEIYQEGLRLGPTKVWSEAGPEQGIVEVICRNSRVPKAIRGDLSAQIVACRTGERELAKLFQRFGVDVVRQAAEQIFAQSETRRPRVRRGDAGRDLGRRGHARLLGPRWRAGAGARRGDDRAATRCTSISAARRRRRRVASTAGWRRRSPRRASPSSSSSTRTSR